MLSLAAVDLYTVFSLIFLLSPLNTSRLTNVSFPLPHTRSFHTRSSVSIYFSISITYLLHSQCGELTIIDAMLFCVQRWVHSKSNMKYWILSMNRRDWECAGREEIFCFSSQHPAPHRHYPLKMSKREPIFRTQNNFNWARSSSILSHHSHPFSIDWWFPNDFHQFPSHLSHNETSRGVGECGFLVHEITIMASGWEWKLVESDVKKAHFSLDFETSLSFTRGLIRKSWCGSEKPSSTFSKKSYGWVTRAGQ